MKPAERTLHQLLDRGQRARVRGSDRLIRIVFENKHDHEYWQLGLVDRDRLHATLKDAEAYGAVDLVWGRFGGDDRTLNHVALKDTDRLAAFLGTKTTDASVREAEEALSQWSVVPRVREILGAWQKLKKVRALGAEAARDFADALRVIAAVEREPEDQLARPLSAALFGDSKRIEALYVHLDILTSESLSDPARHWSEVLTSLGIRKEAQPLMVAGRGELTMRRGPAIPIGVPFVGIAAHALESYQGSPGWLLTVENLTTFHQCAELLGESGIGLVIYTAGMPSPAWLHAYSTILSGTRNETPVYHWGDHDEGGFRIAAHIAKACRAANRQLQPWLMTPAAGTPATRAQHAAMLAKARHAGWAALADRLPALLCEQEFQTPALPK